jgi:hypothetical protein
VDVTLKVEYLHTDLGSEQYFNPSIVVSNIQVITRDTHLSADVVRAGVNLKFNSGGGGWPRSSEAATGAGLLSRTFFQEFID